MMSVYFDELKDMSEEKFIKTWKALQGEYMFYQYAEGQNWYKEKSMREECSHKLRLLNLVAKERGIKYVE